MDKFEKLKAVTGEVDLNGQNLGDVGKKILMHINDDEYIDVVYDVCKYFRDFDEDVARKYREGISREVDLEKAKKFQDRADKISKLIQDEKKYKDNVKRLLTFLENIYLTSNEKSTNEKITPFPIDEGKVLITQESIVHATSFSQLSGISRGGLLASEWFGELESENEGRFCCFFTKVNQNGNSNRVLHNGTVYLYFDTDSPIAKLLFSMDYFAYEKMKSKNPDLIKKIFLPEVVELFETVIEPLSPGGVDMHNYSRTSSWMAIPGGMPSQLVKGIMLSSKEENLDEMAEYCMELFPKATVFDDNKTVLRMPKLYNEELGQKNK